MWLKKVWQICCPSEKYHLKTQCKQGKIVNIRPYNFKNMSIGFQPFVTRLDFVKAIRDTLAEYDKRTYDPNDWYRIVNQQYLNLVGRPL